MSGNPASTYPTSSDSSSSSVAWVTPCAFGRHVIEHVHARGSNHLVRHEHGRCVNCGRPFRRTIRWDTKDAQSWAAR